MNPSVKKKLLIEIFDPAMCCTTGVCGSDVDDSMADFANDVKWLKSQGVEVNRYNLGQSPDDFNKNDKILARLKSGGMDCLPIILVNGEIVSESGYPERSELMSLAGISSEYSSSNGLTANQKNEILTHLEKAVLEGDETAMRDSFKQGEQLGIDKQELLGAMQSGINTRQQITQFTVQKTNELLGITPNGCAPGSGYC